jgi:hypothetical protein
MHALHTGWDNWRSGLTPFRLHHLHVPIKPLLTSAKSHLMLIPSSALRKQECGKKCGANRIAPEIEIRKLRERLEYSEL